MLKFIMPLAIVCFLSACDLQRASTPAPVFDMGLRAAGPVGGGGIILQGGETVWQISQRYRLPLRDIIDLNRLQPPYHLKSGQRLRLPAPREHIVGQDDTLYTLSRQYGVSVSQLVALNKIPAPYHLRTGQVLRLPGREFVAQKNKSLPKQATPKSPDNLVLSPVLPEPVQSEPLVAAAQPQLKTYTPSGVFNPVWPVRGRVISGYGVKANKMYNDGINIAVPKGTPIVAADDGQVVYADDGLVSYGNLVLIRHQGKIVTAYAHLNTISVKKGQLVRQGEVIGTVGSTGNVSSAQLHFEIRQGKETIDPLRFL